MSTPLALPRAPRPPSGAAPAIELRELTKVFRTPAGSFTALDGVDLAIPTGQFAAIVGRSGSGKSTLLHMLAGIDRPTFGSVQVAGTTIDAMDEDAVARWRGTTVGLVFQFHQLMPTLTIAENVIMPMDFCGVVPRSERRSRALALLDRVGIADQAHKMPAAVSGGQQQRAAIARALANDPPVIAADEPTGSLDSTAGDTILDLFRELSTAGRTVVVVTHERDIADRVDRVVTVADGRIVDTGTQGAPRA